VRGQVIKGKQLISAAMRSSQPCCRPSPGLISRINTETGLDIICSKARDDYASYGVATDTDWRRAGALTANRKGARDVAAGAPATRAEVRNDVLSAKSPSTTISRGVATASARLVSGFSRHFPLRRSKFETENVRPITHVATSYSGLWARIGLIEPVAPQCSETALPLRPASFAFRAATASCPSLDGKDQLCSNSSTHRYRTSTVVAVNRILTRPMRCRPAGEIR